MHAHRIAHRDIKPVNVLYQFKEDGDIEVRISDFSLSSEVATETKWGVCGSRRYLSPELLQYAAWHVMIDDAEVIWTGDVYAMKVSIMELFKQHLTGACSRSTRRFINELERQGKRIPLIRKRTTAKDLAALAEKRAKE